MNELVRCVAEGYEAYAVFVVQMEDVKYFTPNNKTHPEFGSVLAAAIKAGVKALAFDCLVAENAITVNRPVEIMHPR